MILIKSKWLLKVLLKNTVSLLTKGNILYKNRETLKSSRGYTGNGTASYPNGDKYTGDFVNGVTAAITIGQRRER